MAKKAKKLFIDAPSTGDIYRGIGTDLSALTDPPSQGRQRIFSILFQIDIFVEEVLASNELAFVIRRGDGSMRFAGNPYATWDEQRGLAIAPLALARHFPLLHIFLQIYSLRPSAEGVRYRIRDNIDGLDNFLDEEYVFGSYVTLFFEGCAKLGLVQDVLMHEKASFPIGNNRVAGDAFNALIEKIRALSKTLETKKTRRAGVTSARLAFVSLEAYVDALFKKQQKLVVLRLELLAGRSLAGESKEEEANLQLKNFLNGRRGKRAIFGELLGYIWKLDWNEKYGYFYHFIFLFPDSGKHADENLLTSIGEYWWAGKLKGLDKPMEIAPSYISPVNSLNKFRSCATGLVKRNDKKRQELLNSIAFLTIKDLFLTVKYGEGTRLVHRGEMPKENAKSTRRLAMPRKPKG